MGDTLKTTEVNQVEVRRLVNELDPHKAHGPNGIPPFVLRVLGDLWQTTGDV